MSEENLAVVNKKNTFNLFELSGIFEALVKVSKSNISMSLRDKILNLIKLITPFLQAMIENEQLLISNSGIKDFKKEMEEKTESYLKLNDEYIKFGTETKKELPEINFTLEDILKYGDSIILNDSEDAAIRQLFIKCGKKNEQL